MAFISMILLIISSYSAGGTIVSMSLSNFREVDMNTTLMFDSFSISFLSTVILVSSMVMVYSKFYFSGFPPKFKLILSMFILSMVVLVMSFDVFWVMVGWDGLGLSSFLLIIYYQSVRSFNSSLITFISNRIGDFFMIGSVVILTCEVGWTSKAIGPPLIFSLLIIIGGFAKSAQVPFSGWLPLAMAAPTPVSALVHSSTLVTAGVFIFIRFYDMIFTSISSELTFFVGTLSVVLAGWSSLGEFDLKKVIALSTLSHVGLMIMMVGVGSVTSAKAHLITHALFKSTLFMIAGVIIHNNSGDQDIRTLNIYEEDLSLSWAMSVCLFSMMGAPFMSGFISKEMMIDETFYQGTSVWWLYLAIGATFSYSVRLFVNLFNFSSSPVRIWTSSTGPGVLLVGSVLSSGVGSLMVMDLLKGFTLFKSVSLNWLIISLLIGVSLGTITPPAFHNLPSWFILPSQSMWAINSIVITLQTISFNLSNQSMTSIDIKGLFGWLIEWAVGVISSWSTSVYKTILWNVFMMMKIASLITLITLILTN
uniref:NADH:ubiquinone reductase (H(+)-translocating) n=1 Tax=Goniodes dissimilis TaxID=186210 RepID=A0A9E9EPP3_9NEOP|nr:NADH dehydrogenase subunit 5 [Goniodes dissimilis]